MVFGLNMLCVQWAWAQSADTFSLVQRFPAQVLLLTTDKLKQIYYVSPQQVLYKCTTQGLVQFEFSNRYLGTLSKVDVSDPFDILLHYADYQTLLFLDRTLNVTADVKLPADQFPLPTLVAMGRDRKVWIYDAALNSLHQMDRQGGILRSSQDLSLLLGRTFNPNQLVCNEQAVYLVDPAQGVLQFDLFAQFQQFFPLPGIEQLQSFDQFLLYRRAGQYYLGNQFSTAQASQMIPGEATFFAGLPQWMVAADGSSIAVFEKK